MSPPQRSRLELDCLTSHGLIKEKSFRGMPSICFSKFQKQATRQLKLAITGYVSDKNEKCLFSLVLISKALSPCSPTWAFGMSLDRQSQPDGHREGQQTALCSQPWPLKILFPNQITFPFTGLGLQHGKGTVQPTIIGYRVQEGHRRHMQGRVHQLCGVLAIQADHGQPFHLLGLSLEGRGLLKCCVLGLDCVEIPGRAFF